MHDYLLGPIVHLAEITRALRTFAREFPEASIGILDLVLRVRVWD